MTPPPSAPSIASVLATPCQNTELTPEAGNLEQIRAATLCLVNQERARDGELPLKISSKLEQAAQSHTEAMVREDYFAHVAPNGETPVDRIQATGYIPNAEAGYTLGENIAWGTLELATPAAIVAAWIASPEHLENILTGAYAETAIGVTAAVPASLANGQTGAVYGQIFGVITG
ncbi:MAG TPA: CAP domain-containing protein [Solirubrobacteraceae bacterium]